MKFDEYIAALRAEMRDAKKRADEYDRTWNRLNDAYDVKHEAEAARRQTMKRLPKAEALKREEKEDSYALSDAFAAQAWWQDKAEAVAAIITAECLAFSTIVEVKRQCGTT